MTGLFIWIGTCASYEFYIVASACYLLSLASSDTQVSGYYSVFYS